MSVTVLASKTRRHAQAPINPTFLQTPEAAARLGLAPGTLDKMRVRGDGPSYLRLTPRRVVYAVDVLDTWARSRNFNSTSEYERAAAG
jgi:predicted DNA-binding transcriptional regulator AlpA